MTPGERLVHDLRLRVRSRRGSWLVAVVGGGPSSLVATWKALRVAAPDALVTCDTRLLQRPPSSIGLHALTPGDAGALNLYRNTLAARGLRTVFWVAEEDLGAIKAAAPDLWDWVEAVWAGPDDGPLLPVRRVARAIRERRVIAWYGSNEALHATLAAAGRPGLGRSLYALSPYAQSLEEVRSPVRRWLGLQHPIGIARARWAEAEAATEGVCVALDPRWWPITPVARDGAWPGAVRVAGEPVPLVEVARGMDAAGAPLRVALDLALDGFELEAAQHARLTPEQWSTLLSAPDPGQAVHDRLWSNPARPSAHDDPTGAVAWDLIHDRSEVARLRGVYVARDFGQEDVASHWSTNLTRSRDPEIRWGAALASCWSTSARPGSEFAMLLRWTPASAGVAQVRLPWDGTTPEPLGPRLARAEQDGAVLAAALAGGRPPPPGTEVLQEQLGITQSVRLAACLRLASHDPAAAAKGLDALASSENPDWRSRGLAAVHGWRLGEAVDLELAGECLAQVGDSMGLFWLTTASSPASLGLSPAAGLESLAEFASLADPWLRVIGLGDVLDALTEAPQYHEHALALCRDEILPEVERRGDRFELGITRWRMAVFSTTLGDRQAALSALDEASTLLPQPELAAALRRVRAALLGTELLRR